MAGLLPESKRDGKKRKYNHNPLMKVGLQSINLEGSSYQVIRPTTLAQRPLVFQPVNSTTSKARASKAGTPADGSRQTNSAGSAQLILPPAPVNDLTVPPTNAEESSKKAFTEDSFVINTIGNGGMELGERPAAKRRRLQMESQKRIFRPSRPIKISPMVNSDIWQTIFSYCEPKLLVEAKTLSKDFCQLLNDRMGIWKQSRQNHFGQDMPDCPQGMSEQQYVDLLVRRGCQNRDCPKDNTSRVYWTFQVRLCAECFKSKTMRADELPPHRKHYLAETQDPDTPGKPLWDLLPLARTDGRRYLRPRSVDLEANDWSSTHVLRQYVFLRSSYMTLETEYLALLERGAEWPEVKVWMDNKHNETIKYMTAAINLESWQKPHVSLNENKLVKSRMDFFEDRAAELDPPMEANILLRMAAYHKCLKVQAAPTERSWRTLKEKILPYRLQAETVEQYRMDMRSLSRFSRIPAKLLHAKLHDHRSNRKDEIPSYQPEQKYVLGLARQEFKKCLDANVADGDLLLLCLRNVFEEHAKTSNPPRGLNYDGSTGPYQLSLDDARMIVEEVMEKYISKTSLRGGAVLQNLRCRGCRRLDFVRTFSFVEAFEHILEAHSVFVGKGLEFWQFAIPYGDPDRWSSVGAREDCRFPWYTVPWPRCLPLVPGHYDISTLTDWHPAVVEPFIQQSRPPTKSMFDDLVPRRTEIQSGDMTLNMIHAAKKLKGTRLDTHCQMAIILKYALDLYLETQTSEPPISVLVESVEGLRDANSALDLRFRCNACLDADETYRTARHTKTKLSIEKLLVHWDDKHSESGRPWTSMLMQLPTDAEVTQQIEESDKKLEGEKEAMRERNAKLPLAIKKRPKLKEQVVLNARLAAEAVHELFTDSR